MEVNIPKTIRRKIIKPIIRAGQFRKHFCKLKFYNCGRSLFVCGFEFAAKFQQIFGFAFVEVLPQTQTNPRNIQNHKENQQFEAYNEIRVDNLSQYQQG